MRRRPPAPPGASASEPRRLGRPSDPPAQRLVGAALASSPAAAAASTRGSAGRAPRRRWRRQRLALQLGRRSRRGRPRLRCCERCSEAATTTRPSGQRRGARGALGVGADRRGRDVALELDARVGGADGLAARSGRLREPLDQLGREHDQAVGQARSGRTWRSRRVLAELSRDALARPRRMTTRLRAGSPRPAGWPRPSPPTWPRCRDAGSTPRRRPARGVRPRLAGRSTAVARAAVRRAARSRPRGDVDVVVRRHAPPAAPRRSRSPPSRSGTSAAGRGLHRDAPGARRWSTLPASAPAMSAWRRSGPASSRRVAHARELVAAGEIGDAARAGATRARSATTTRPSRLFDARARRRLGRWTCGVVRRLARPALARRRPDAGPPPGRRTPPAPTRSAAIRPRVRRRAGCALDLRARQPRRRRAPRSWARRLDRAGAAARPRRSGRRAPHGAERRWLDGAPDAATPTRPREVRAAWPPDSPRARSMPLADDPRRQSVLEEALGQLGIAHGRGAARRLRAQAQRQRLRHSMAGQVSITIGTPAAVVRANASSSTTPSWNHTPLAPIATAWSANSPAASERRNTSTTSIGERHVGERRRSPARRAPRGAGSPRRVDRHDPLAALLEQRGDGVRRAVGVAGQARRRPRSRSRRA